MIENILIELAILVGVGILISGIALILKQPLTISYIATGIIIGPSLLNIAKTTNFIDSFAQFGIVILLFTVGVGLSPKVFRKVGKASLLTGVGQILITALVGFVISKTMGYSLLASLYVAIALTLSSTIIVMKYLSDSGDGETLYGRISVGVLLLQDVAVMIIMVILASLSVKSAGNSLTLSNLGIIFGILLLLVPVSVYVLPRLLKEIAKSQEYLLLFSIGWCLLLAISFYKLNFSMEIGALLAGVALSVSSYRHEIVSRVKPLRDFFIFLFFVSLGTQLDLANVGKNIWPIVILSFFTLIAKPIIIYLIMNLQGYTKKSSLMAGLALAQISEFSIILLAMGIKLGNISNDILSVITMVTLVSIAGSTYFMTYNKKIFSALSKILPNLNKNKKTSTGIQNNTNDNDIIMFGYDKIGFSLLKLFHKTNKKYLIIDYNPEVIKFLETTNKNCMYGDAEDTHFLDELKLSSKKMVISTVPVFDTNLLILKKIREYSNKTIVILVSNSIDDSLKLYSEGASYVIIPRHLGGEHASKIIEKNEYDLDKFSKDRLAHLEGLGDRSEIKHFL